MTKKLGPVGRLTPLTKQHHENAALPAWCTWSLHDRVLASTPEECTETRRFDSRSGHVTDFFPSVDEKRKIRKCVINKIMLCLSKNFYSFVPVQSTIDVPVLTPPPSSESETDLSDQEVPSEDEIIQVGASFTAPFPELNYL